MILLYILAKENMIIRKDKNGDEIIINTSREMDKIYNQDSTKKKNREDKKKQK